MVPRVLYYVLIGFVILPAKTSRAQSYSASNANDRKSESSIPASIGTHCDPDFFIVNSIRYPQRSNGCLPKCDGVIHRYLPDEQYHASDLDTMIAALRPGVPVCLAIHGSFFGSKNLYPQSVNRYKRILESANDRPIHFIAVHWLSDPGLLLLPTVQVNQLGKRAEFNGIYLAQLITRIPPENPVSMIGHSHGCRVVASALHLLGGGIVQGVAVADPHPGRRIRAVFGAGAIDQHWLNPGERYGCALNRVEWLLNIRNRMDGVLNLYPLLGPFLHRAIGQAGFRRRDLRMIGGNVEKIVEYDVTQLVGAGHMISHYAPHPQIRAAFIPYLYFD